MREFLNKHGAYVAVGLLLIAAVAAYLLGFSKREPNVSHAYFVDEETGEEQVLSLEEYPPRINPKTGKPTLVQEIKYSPDGGKTVKVAYYLKYSEGTKAALEKAFKQTGKPVGIDVSGGTYVRSPDKNSKWTSRGSTDGAAITRIDFSSASDFQMVLPP